MSPHTPNCFTKQVFTCFGWLEDIKKEQRYIGRYSVEKLCVFQAYQAKTSIYRVIAVILLTPLPTILTLWALDCMPLRDPRGGAKQHATTFLRSILSHALMTYTCLLCVKQAAGLNRLKTTYTHKRLAVISLCVAVCLESWWIIWAFNWRFPIPCREFLGVTPWMILIGLFNYAFAKDELTRVWGRLRRYIPVVGAQMTLFFFLLFLSVGFSAVPWWAQIVMIFAFPVVKIAIKRALWKYARNLHDISADVAICMVEISGSLYQTVCMNYVQSTLMVLLLMGLDFAQAADETHLYARHDHTNDSKPIVQSALEIVKNAVFKTSKGKTVPGHLVKTHRYEDNTDEVHGTKSPSDEVSAKVQPIHPSSRDILFTSAHRPNSLLDWFGGCPCHFYRFLVG